MKRLATLGLLTLAAVATFVAVAVAQGRLGCPRGDAAAVTQCQKTLGLSAEQTKKVDALRADFGKKIDPLAGKLREKAQALRQLQTADKPDAKALAALESEVATLRGDLRKARLAYHEAVGKVLTDEQKKKLAASGTCPCGGDPANCPGPCEDCPGWGGDCGDGCGMKPGHGPGGCGMGRCGGHGSQ